MYTDKEIVENIIYEMNQRHFEVDRDNLTVSIIDLIQAFDDYQARIEIVRDVINPYTKIGSKK